MIVIAEIKRQLGVHDQQNLGGIIAKFVEELELCLEDTDEEIEAKAKMKEKWEREDYLTGQARPFIREAQKDSISFEPEDIKFFRTSTGSKYQEDGPDTARNAELRREAKCRLQGIWRSFDSHMDRTKGRLYPGEVFGFYNVIELDIGQIPQHAPLDESALEPHSVPTTRRPQIQQPSASEYVPMPFDSLPSSTKLPRKDIVALASQKDKQKTRGEPYPQPEPEKRCRLCFPSAIFFALEEPTTSATLM